MNWFAKDFNCTWDSGIPLIGFRWKDSDLSRLSILSTLWENLGFTYKTIDIFIKGILKWKNSAWSWSLFVNKSINSAWSWSLFVNKSINSAWSWSLFVNKSINSAWSWSLFVNKSIIWLWSWSLFVNKSIIWLHGHGHCS